MSFLAKLAAIAMILIVSGCVTTAPPPTASELASAYYGPYPSEYERVIKEYMSVRLKDPYSAHYEFLIRPSTGYLSLKENIFGWLVCVDINAKNSYGGYTGAKPNIFLLRDGRVVHAEFSGGNTQNITILNVCRSLLKQP